MKWSKYPVTFTQNNTCYVSTVFTWHLPLVKNMINDLTGQKIIAGGPAVKLMPDYLPPENCTLQDSNGWLQRHNSGATRTSLGCPRKCYFCPVWKIEPEFKELSSFEPKPIVCDNNFLACSREHIKRVIQKLKGIKHIDFNQGLDARLLKAWHIEEFKKLHWSIIRLSWDSAEQESSVMRAIELLVKTEFNAKKIGCYVLVCLNESPEEALYRCEAIKSKGVMPFVQRYQPLDTLEKSSYRPPQWDRIELIRFLRYWNRQNWLKKVPYREFVYGT